MSNRRRKKPAGAAAAGRARGSTARLDSQVHRTVLWWLCQAAGVIFLIYAARLWLHALRLPVAVYDEGIILTDSFMVRHGYWPHRDFYANYPPGTWFTVNAVWSLLGQTVQAERMLGAMVHLAVTGLAGRLVGRATHTSP